MLMLMLPTNRLLQIRDALIERFGGKEKAATIGARGATPVPARKNDKLAIQMITTLFSIKR